MYVYARVSLDLPRIPTSRDTSAVLNDASSSQPAIQLNPYAYG